MTLTTNLEAHLPLAHSDELHNEAQLHTVQFGARVRLTPNYPFNTSTVS